MTIRKGFLSGISAAAVIAMMAAPALATPGNWWSSDQSTPTVTSASQAALDAAGIEVADTFGRTGMNFVSTTDQEFIVVGGAATYEADVIDPYAPGTFLVNDQKQDLAFTVINDDATTWDHSGVNVYDVTSAHTSYQWGGTQEDLDAGYTHRVVTDDLAGLTWTPELNQKIAEAGYLSHNLDTLSDCYVNECGVWVQAVETPDTYATFDGDMYANPDIDQYVVTDQAPIWVGIDANNNPAAANDHDAKEVADLALHLGVASEQNTIGEWGVGTPASPATEADFNVTANNVGELINVSDPAGGVTFADGVDSLYHVDGDQVVALKDQKGVYEDGTEYNRSFVLSGFDIRQDAPYSGDAFVSTDTNMFENQLQSTVDDEGNLHLYRNGEELPRFAGVDDPQTQNVTAFGTQADLDGYAYEDLVQVSGNTVDPITGETVTYWSMSFPDGSGIPFGAETGASWLPPLEHYRLGVDELEVTYFFPPAIPEVPEVPEVPEDEPEVPVTEDEPTPPVTEETPEPVDPVTPPTQVIVPPSKINSGLDM